MTTSTPILNFIQTVSRLEKKVNRTRQLFMNSMGLSGSDLSVFLVLHNEESGLRMDQLIEATQTDKAQVSRSLKALADKKMVIRPEPKTYKGRYRLSEKGREIADELEAHCLRVFYEAHTSIASVKEWEGFYEFVKKMEIYLDCEIEQFTKKENKKVQEEK